MILERLKKGKRFDLLAFAKSKETSNLLDWYVSTLGKSIQEKLNYGHKKSITLTLQTGFGLSVWLLPDDCEH